MLDIQKTKTITKDSIPIDLKKDIKETKKIISLQPKKKSAIRSVNDIELSEFLEKFSGDSFMAKANFFLLKLSRVPLKEKLFFVQNLSLMLRVGISISKALKTLAIQAQNKYFKYVLIKIAYSVENGRTFSESLGEYKNIFGELFINTIESGELSGKLENVLKELYIQMKKEHALISKVKGALTYPLVILVAMLGIGTFMVVAIVPKITQNFIEMNMTLPLPTRILIFVSDLIRHNAIIVTIVLCIFIFILIKIHRTPKGKSFFDKILLKAPIIGPITKKINLAKFSRNINLLLKTDIMIVRAFEITSDVLNNSHYKKAVFEMSVTLKKGDTLTNTIEKYPILFPPTIVQMINIGEETGDLDNILLELAEFYEGEVDQIMTDLPSLIEPILILVLGIAVGGMALSILLPMYSMSSAF